MARLYGFRDLVYAILTETDYGFSYGPVYRLRGAVSCDVSANDGEPFVLESDDVEKERLSQAHISRIAFEIDQLFADDECRIYGRTKDNYGVVVKKKGDKPAYVALGFKCAYTNDVDAYIWFLKAAALPDGMNAKTKEKKNISPVTKKIEFEAVERNLDGHFEYHVLSSDADFATKKATFFDAPYEADLEPCITINEQPENAAVTVGSVAGTLTVDADAVPSGSLTYQWYKPTTQNIAAGDTAVSGATSASLTIPTNLTAGTHYFYCKISLSGANTVYTNVAQVVASA